MIYLACSSNIFFLSFLAFQLPSPRHGGSRINFRTTFFELTVGLGFSRTNADSQWNPVYNAFHRFILVETKRFVCSLVHVIFMRQTCGQRSSMAAESTRRALGNYFSERVCYMFPMSKCSGEWNLGLCTTLVLWFGEPQRKGKIRIKNVFLDRKNRILHLRWGSQNERNEVVRRPRSQSPLHFDIRNM